MSGLAWRRGSATRDKVSGADVHLWTRRVFHIQGVFMETKSHPLKWLGAREY